MELNILCNFGRGHYNEHSCEIISNLDPEIKDEMLFKEKVHAQRTKTDHIAFDSGELKMMGEQISQKQNIHNLSVTSHTKCIVAR